MDTIELSPVLERDIPCAVDLLCLLNTSTSAEVIRQRLETILKDHPHYRLIGAYAGDRLVGVCGAWIATKIWSGKYLEVDNLVVHPDARSAKLGTRMVEYLEKIAREEKCDFVILGSYTSNYPSHRLYHRLGFEIWGYQFVKPLNP